MRIGRLTVRVYETYRVASAKSFVFWLKDLMSRTGYKYSNRLQYSIVAPH